MSSLQLKRKSMLLPTQLKTELKRVGVCFWCARVCECLCRGCQSAQFSSVVVVLVEEAGVFSGRWKALLFHRTPPLLGFFLWPVAGGCSSFKKFSSSLLSHALLAYEFPWLQFRPIGWLYQADICAQREPSDKTLVKTKWLKPVVCWFYCSRSSSLYPDKCAKLETAKKYFYLTFFTIIICVWFAESWF